MRGRLTRETIQFPKVAAWHAQSGGIAAENKRVMIAETRSWDRLHIDRH
jgi:hypothetical protein